MSVKNVEIYILYTNSGVLLCFTKPRLFCKNTYKVKQTQQNLSFSLELHRKKGKVSVKII